MSDLTYRIIRAFGYPILWVTSRPVILHIERVNRPGAYILAPNHNSPYDVAGLIGITRRNLDFLSIAEFLNRPIVTPFFKAMNCTFVDRNRTDPTAAHGLAARLRQGRAIAMFPEAGIRSEETSVINGGSFKPGVVRLAQLTGAPIIPCVILGTAVYSKFRSYFPTRSIRWGVTFGNDIQVPDGENPRQIREAATETLRANYLSLYEELKAGMAQVGDENDRGTVRT